MKINWKQKLSSRKFWVALIGFISTLCIAFGIPEITTEEIIAVVSAMGTLVAYIICEGMVDAAHTKNDNESKGERGNKK